MEETSRVFFTIYEKSNQPIEIARRLKSVANPCDRKKLEKYAFEIIEFCCDEGSSESYCQENVKIQYRNKSDDFGWQDVGRNEILDPIPDEIQVFLLKMNYSTDIYPAESPVVCLSTPQSLAEIGDRLRTPNSGAAACNQAIGMSDNEEIEVEDDGELDAFKFTENQAIPVIDDLNKIDPNLCRNLKTKVVDDWNFLSVEEQNNWRRKLVRTVVKHYMSKETNMEIPRQKLALLAYSLTVHFPTLKDGSTELGYEWLYSPRSKRGVMRQCYYTLRHIHPGVKKRPYKRQLGFAGDTNADTQLTQEEVTQKKHELKEIIPSSDRSRIIIRNLMEDTQQARQRWIVDHGPTITDILTEWPRLSDSSEEIVSESQFALQRQFVLPHQLDFGSKFEQAAIHIARIGFDCKSPMQRQIYQAFQVVAADQLPNMSTEEVCILALLNLPHLVNASRSILCRKKGGQTDNVSAVSATHHLLRFIPNDAKAVEIHVRDMKRADAELTQPFLFGVTINGAPEAVSEDDPSVYYLILDNRAFPVNGTISQAISLLFHSYHAFNVQYSPRLVTVYRFFQKLFGLKAKRGFSKLHEVPPCATNFYMQLKPKMATDDQ